MECWPLQVQRSQQMDGNKCDNTNEEKRKAMDGFVKDTKRSCVTFSDHRSHTLLIRETFISRFKKSAGVAVIKPDHFRNKIAFYCRKNATKTQRNYKCVKCAPIAANSFMPLNFYAFDYKHTRIRINCWPSALCVDRLLLPAYSVRWGVRSSSIRYQSTTDARDVSDAMRVIHQGQCLDHRQAYRVIHMDSLFNSMHNEFTYTHAHNFHVKNIVNFDHKTLSLPFDGIM